MKKILDQLNEAYLILSAIPVAGDNVDTMAAAKTILRRVAGELKEMDGAGRCPAVTETGGEGA